MERELTGEHFNALPKEIWVAIFRLGPFILRIGTISVSSKWRAAIYDSVISFEGCETSSLTDMHLSRFIALEQLVLSEPFSWRRKFRHVTNDGVKRLAGTLTMLNIRSNKHITDVAVKCLVKLTNLVVRGTTVITDDGLSGLTNLTNLDASRRRGVRFSFGHLARLTYLDLSCCKNTASGESLTGLSELRSLNLFRNECVTDEHIQGLSNLTSLDLSCNDVISDLGICSLVCLTRLRMVEAKIITNKGLSNLTALTDLDLTKATNVALNSDGLLRLTNLTKLNLEHSDVNVGAALSRLTKLNTLSLCENGVIESDDIRGLVNLTSLDLSENRKVTDEGISGLSNLATLIMYDSV
jgi:Leucine-rich repeat (LRR) protein